MSTPVMMERITEASPRSEARIAGVFYLLTFLTGGVAVPSFRLIVSGDAAATATNILAHEVLFRLGFAALLITLSGRPFCLEFWARGWRLPVWFG